MISVIILIVSSALGSEYLHHYSDPVSLFAVPRLLLAVRGLGVGGAEGLRRCVHAGVLCLFSPGQITRTLPSLHQPAEGPKPLGQDGGIPSLGTIYINLR